MRFVVIAVGWAFLAAGCQRPAPLAPPPDVVVAPIASQDATPGGSAAPDPSGCAHACANLARLGCSEGLQTTCEATCRHAQEITDFDARCMADAGDPDAARLCAGLGPKGCRAK